MESPQPHSQDGEAPAGDDAGSANLCSGTEGEGGSGVPHSGMQLEHAAPSPVPSTIQRAATLLEQSAVRATGAPTPLPVVLKQGTKRPVKDEGGEGGKGSAPLPPPPPALLAEASALDEAPEIVEALATEESVAFGLTNGPRRRRQRVPEASAVDEIREAEMVEEKEEEKAEAEVPEKVQAEKEDEGEAEDVADKKNQESEEKEPAEAAEEAEMAAEEANEADVFAEAEASEVAKVAEMSGGATEDAEPFARRDIAATLAGDSQAVLCGEMQAVLCGETQLPGGADSPAARFLRPAAVQRQHAWSAATLDTQAPDDSQALRGTQALDSQALGGASPGSSPPRIADSAAADSAAAAAAAADEPAALLERNRQPEPSVEREAGPGDGEGARHCSTFDVAVLLDTQDHFLAVGETQAPSQAPFSQMPQTHGDSESIDGSTAPHAEGGEANSALSEEEDEVEEEAAEEAAEEPHSEDEEPCSEEESCDPVRRAMAQFVATGVLNDGTFAEPLAEVDEKMTEGEDVQAYAVASAAADAAAADGDCDARGSASASRGGGRSAASAQRERRATAQERTPPRSSSELPADSSSGGSTGTPTTQQVEAMSRAVLDRQGRGVVAEKLSAFDGGDDCDYLSEEDGQSPPRFARPPRPPRLQDAAHSTRPAVAAAATAARADDADEVEEEESQQVLFSLPPSAQKKRPLPKPQAPPHAPLWPRPEWRSPQDSAQDSLAEPSGRASPPVSWAAQRQRRSAEKAAAAVTAAAAAQRRQSVASTALALPRPASARSSTSTGFAGGAGQASEWQSPAPDEASSEAAVAPEEDFDADAEAATFKSRKRASTASSGARGRPSHVASDASGHTLLDESPATGSLHGGRPSVATTADYATSPGTRDWAFESPAPGHHASSSSISSNRSNGHPSSGSRNQPSSRDPQSSRDPPRSGQQKKRPLDDLSAAACNSRCSRDHLRCMGCRFGHVVFRRF
jgi:hypothetical protein